MSYLKTNIKLIDDRAEIPRRAHDSDTGYDLKMIDIHKITGDTIFFKTGIAIQPPRGYYFEIVPRSSISKLPLMLSNSIGVIDEHYTGEVIVPIKLMHSRLGENIGNQTFPAGITTMFDKKVPSLYDAAKLILDKKPTLCQLILRKREDTLFNVVDFLDETVRGDGGFGSTDEPSITSASARKEMLRNS